MPPPANAQTMYVCNSDGRDVCVQLADKLVVERSEDPVSFSHSLIGLLSRGRTGTMQLLCRPGTATYDPDVVDMA